MASRNGSVPEHFMGYVRPDGQVGIRNYVLLLSGTLYANVVCERVADMVVNCIPIVHPLGRCQVMPDLRLTFRTLVGTGRNPNAGAVIVVDHFKETGCTADEIAHEISKTGKPVEVVNIRRDHGAIESTAKAMRLAMEMNRQISRQMREKVHVRHLVLGLNCGTSDGTAGLSHNKASGKCSDMVIARGGRSILAETTEQMGGEHFLAERCVTKKLAEKIYANTSRMERRALECGEDIRGSQPTGDNMEGGLSTIEEKSLGAIQKAGTAPIVGVVDFAEPIGKKSGLWVMDSPGHGGESITGICASGAQILVFSTGGGHTINHPLMITIRSTGNKTSFELMKDTMELDLSDMFDDMSLEEAGEKVYREVIDTCSGMMTKAEVLKEYNAFAIHSVGPSI